MVECLSASSLHTIIARFNRFLSVLLMDATYKTNQMKMPLLEAVGMTSDNTMFFLCECFMSKEATNDYTWAITKMQKLCFINASPVVTVTDKERTLISAIQEALPGTQNLLRRWHIEKSVFPRLETMVPAQARVDTGMRRFLDCPHNVSISRSPMSNGK